MPQEIRLYIKNHLQKNSPVTLEGDQAHYLANVMRAKPGDKVSLFNGSAGQWQAEISFISKKSIGIIPLEQTREQTTSPDIWLVFAPIKNKTELVVEKATELGVSKIIPIVTRHCVVRSVNMEKLETHALEASEQCERLDIPALETHKDLSYLLGAWDKNRTLLYGDESGGGESLAEILGNMKQPQKLAILIGPEGGFAADEFAMLRACDFAIPFGMGPRILRADTAAVSALACVMAQAGDWDIKPHFVGKGD